MTVPFVDLKVQYQNLKPAIDEAIANVINETAFVGGKYVEEFELAFAKAYGVKHCISVANGTDSLYIIMKMLGIGAGDEVITVANSWISSSETISQTGAKTVFADIHPGYYTIDVSQVAAKITSRTKAIVPVHLYGQVCQMDALLALAEKHGLKVIEDCAQSHFSRYNGQLAGTMGVAGSFSFYPGKNLGAYGDAGCIVTNDDSLAEQCRRFARHGALKKHEHTIEGINSRMDGMQAAILSVKLPHILLWTKERQSHAAYYTKALAQVKQISLPAIMPGCSHTFHLYVIRAEKRDELMTYLKERNIETAVHYPTALPFLPAYHYLQHQPSHFPVAHAYQRQLLSLPMYPELTVPMMDHVINAIKDFYHQ